MVTIWKNIGAVLVVAIFIFGVVWMAGQAIDEGLKDDGAIVEVIK